MFLALKHVLTPYRLWDRFHELVECCLFGIPEQEVKPRGNLLNVTVKSQPILADNHPLHLLNCGILTVLWRRTCQVQTLYLQQLLPITLGQKKIKLLSQPSLLPSGCPGHVYSVNEGDTKFWRRHCSLEASEIMWRIRHYVMSLSSGPCQFSH